MKCSQDLSNTNDPCAQTTSDDLKSVNRYIQNKWQHSGDVTWITRGKPNNKNGLRTGNSLVIASVTKFEYLQTVPNIFIANLAAADILAGIFLPVFYVFGVLQERVDYCYIYIYAAAIPFFASLTFLMLIALDRTLCIAKPFFYERNMTVRRAIFVVNKRLDFCLYEQFLASGCTWCTGKGQVWDRNIPCPNILDCL